MTVPVSAARMQILTLCDMSVYYHIYDEVVYHDLSGQIRVAVEFPFSGTLVEPASVVINEGDYSDEIFEIGGGAQANFIYTLDIYGQNKTQRDELAWLIKMWLEENDVVLRDYNEGFPNYTNGYPPTNVPSSMTNMEALNIRLPSPADIQSVGEVPDKMRYWRQLFFTLDFIVPSDYRP